MSAPQVRPMALAGWDMLLPRSLRLFETDGSHRRGHFALSDVDQARLHLSWDSVTRKRLDAKDFVTRRLAKAAGRPVSEIATSRVVIAGSPLSPLHRYDDVAGGRHVYVGYCPITRRGVQVVHKPTASALENRLLQEGVEKHLRGQDEAAGQRWAFFGISFMAPPGFVQESVRLELGDMVVELAESARVTRRDRIEARFIYPGSLAMSRGPLEDWLEGIVRKTANTYLPSFRRPLRRKDMIFEPMATEVGPAVVTRARLRGPAAMLLYRRHARYQSNFAVHAEQYDKLLLIRIATADPDTARPLLDKLLAGLNWAGTSEEG